ncbi:ATP-binding protein [Sphingobacterium daejeonense]|uniref:ATP-binding protein n=1 Tax=Sphingobacterium daejeonense TaxID=371142 RepID=UPI0010C332BF|nr:sensor histidine kinase [Sphingobacterium daejeonense]VTP98101.1 Adaptive-response sensory-kinase sasA [Sphingobacterium daejeonense]
MLSNTAQKEIIQKFILDSKIKHEFVEYTIADNGIGIAKEELSMIFDSFKRLSNAGNFEGTGLGLSIVKRIVDRLGMQIKIESELGKGTTIHLLFPNTK